MQVTEADIIHETPTHWVLRNRSKRKSYDVLKLGPQVSTTVQSFAFDEDGKSLAIAYCDYLSLRDAARAA